MENNLKTQDIIPNYKDKYYIQAKETLQKLKTLSAEYSGLDNLYDMDSMERIKRQMTAQLELLGEHYARVKSYKSIGDYLEEQRKALKADTVGIIVDGSSVSVNQAEKLVYGHQYYKDRMSLIIQLRRFFILVETMYERHTDTLNNLRQSISLCRKDPNFQPVENA